MSAPPLLSDELLEFPLRLPPEWKLKGQSLPALGTRPAYPLAVPGPDLHPLVLDGQLHSRHRPRCLASVVDRLAATLGSEWTREEQALVAHAEWEGQTVYLVKPLSKVNASGEVLARLTQHLGFGPAECILVYDDIDLPLGAVRVRMRGSDGGHKGVRSTIQAFQTDMLRRVKIGVGRPAQRKQAGDHVLTAFSPEELPGIEQACAEAAEQALKLLTPAKRPRSS